MGQLLENVLGLLDSQRYAYIIRGALCKAASGLARTKNVPTTQAALELFPDRSVAPTRILSRRLLGT
ncbi:hypothetical protein FA13DRAFT_1740131 [Coprinellus micaceus]|uniref:Uncharacterized protein n=1 Tax=Coprinellus micaceus TaxID=71717 RepID=A0A4Y7SP26_COPMI|nr:hypothetical protein FA13DRAFT_1740131 [Coprinellus micaceus]